MEFIRVASGLLSLLCFNIFQNFTSAQTSPPPQEPPVAANALSPVNHRLNRVELCPGKVISQTHRYRSTKARSVLECVTFCGSDVRCLSLVFDVNNTTCYFGEDIARLDCSNMVPGHQGTKYYETKIVCEGAFEEPGPGGTCICVKGYRGSPCAPYFADCEDAYRKGNFSGQGIITIHPDLSPKPFQVYCKKLTNYSRTYILQRRTKSMSFNRSFADYQKGFGDVSDEHWLGLDKVYQLTNSVTYELRVTARLLNNSNLFMQYQQFRISNASDGYRLWFNLTTDEVYLLGDCFSPLLGARFSAFDHDQDEAGGVNCASKHAGGWWFRGSNCSTCNPTGRLLKPENGLTTGDDSEVFWKHNLGNAAVFRLSMFLILLD